MNAPVAAGGEDDRPRQKADAVPPREKERRLREELNATLMTAKDTIDPTLQKIERMAVVSSTPISYSQSELLQLIHEHLVHQGLTKAAKALAAEAKLPSTSTSSSSSSSASPSTATGSSNTTNPPENENTLDMMVRQYCIDQHRRCPHPISVLPPFPLITPHRCPVPSHFTTTASRAPKNITSRLLARQAISNPPQGGLRGNRLMRRFVYSRFRPVRTYRYEEMMFTCSTFYSSNRLLAGTQSGELVVFNVDSTQPLRTWPLHGTLQIQQIFIEGLWKDFSELNFSHRIEMFHDYYY